MLWALLLSMPLVGAAGRACKEGPSSRIPIDGFPGESYLAGAGGEVESGKLRLRHNAGVTITTACSKSWRAEDFALFQLLGKTLSYTVDISHVGCACNVAIYLIYAPPRAPDGRITAGECPASPYYCDANRVCGSFCPEMDIMEANNRVFQTTPHRCDGPDKMGHYSSCDRAGCFVSTRDSKKKVYGPGASYRINTQRPFEVHTTFHGNVTMDGRSSFTGLTTRLVQGRNTLELVDPACRSYIKDLAQPLANGMSMRITYWGNGAANMSWMDQPPCGNEPCRGKNAGEAVIYDMRVAKLATIAFPESFEAGRSGSCPPHWTCTGEAQVCRTSTNSAVCNNSGLSLVHRDKYLSAGSDQGTGIATSPIFLLPKGIDHLSFRRGGGAGVGSGLYLRRRNDSEPICFSENSTDTNALFHDSCNGLAGHEGEAVYLEIRDTQRSPWGRVVVDDIWLLDKHGANLSAGEAAWEHAGKDCLPHCRGKAGYCSWCGGGGACCRTDWPSDPAECQGAQHTIAGRHECVIASEEATSHEGEDCWSHCGGSGYCTWCGSGNACCRAGWHNQPEECRGVTHSEKGFHECVIPVSRHLLFPVSFKHVASGRCPHGWTCTGGTEVCVVGEGHCGHPELSSGTVLAIGGGAATSPIFLLPADVAKVRFKRGGQGGEGSGFYVNKRRDGSTLCASEWKSHIPRLASAECSNLAGHDGEEVYIHIRDGGRSGERVFIDDIQLVDTSGAGIHTSFVDASSPQEAVGEQLAFKPPASDGANGEGKKGQDRGGQSTEEEAAHTKMMYLGLAIGSLCTLLTCAVWCQAYASIRGMSTADYARLLVQDAPNETRPSNRTGQTLASGGTLLAL